MSFAVGAFSGGARGAGGGGGGGRGASNNPNRARQDQNTSQHNDGKDVRVGFEGDVETPNTTNTPLATASLMFHAITSGIGAIGKDSNKK